MPARITMLRGVSAGSIHEIQANFQRIGSDLSCDICLPSSDIPPLAVLLEYVESIRKYRVHCRAQDAVYYQGRLMNPGEKRDWDPGQEISIGTVVTLGLETDADPRPVRPESNRVERQRDLADQLAASAETAPRRETREPTDVAAKDGTQLLKLLVIIVCLAACPVILFHEHIFPKASPPAPRSMKYNDIVQLLKDESGTAETALYLDILRQAHREEVRSRAAAKKHYLILRKKVMDDIESNEGKANDTQKELLRYINVSLSRLS